MGLQYLYFTAADDDAAMTAFSAQERLPAPTVFMEEVRLHELAEFEHLLTGRSVEEIEAESRYLVQLAAEFDEDAGVDLSGLMTVTDTFARALAEADLSRLPDPYQTYHPDALRQLAEVAQHAIAHGHHMYGVWVV